MASGRIAEAKPRRGRPRSEGSRRAILSAVSELIVERDLSEISMDALAERAKVGKATIYRWWPSKELLVLEALRSEWDSASPDEIDTGSLAGDLKGLIYPWARELTSRRYGRLVAALVSRAQVDEEFAREYRTHFVTRRRERARIALERAVARQEISADTDVEAALDLLYGPIFHRLLHGHAPLTDDFVRTSVDHVVVALGATVRVAR